MFLSILTRSKCSLQFVLHGITCYVVNCGTKLFYTQSYILTSIDTKAAKGAQPHNPAFFTSGQNLYLAKTIAYMFAILPPVKILP